MAPHPPLHRRPAERGEDRHPADDGGEHVPNLGHDAGHGQDEDHGHDLGACASLDPELREQLVTFETFFKTFGFKRIQGRVWGLLVLAGQPLSSKDVMAELGISQGAASTTLNSGLLVKSFFFVRERKNINQFII